MTSPLFPELVTEGDTATEALEHVQDALAAVIETYQDLGRTLPAGTRWPEETGPVWLETLGVARACTGAPARCAGSPLSGADAP